MTLPDRPRNPVGGHVPVAGGLARVGLAWARDIGAETVQVFVANPRGWATPDGNPARDERFRAECAAEGLSAYVHAPYLINFGSHTPETAEKSVHSLRHSLRRGREIGAPGVVVHTGSATGGRPREVALAQVRERMLPLLDELTRDDDPYLLLESTAGRVSRSARSPRTSARTSTRSALIPSSASASTPATSSRRATIWPRPAGRTGRWTNWWRRWGRGGSS